MVRKYGVKEDEHHKKYHINCNFIESSVVNFYYCLFFYDIYFCRLLDDDIPKRGEKEYNYIIACDSCGLKGSKLKQKEEYVLRELEPEERHHFIRFEKKWN